MFDLFSNIMNRISHLTLTKTHQHTKLMIIIYDLLIYRTTNEPKGIKLQAISKYDIL